MTTDRGRFFLGTLMGFCMTLAGLVILTFTEPGQMDILAQWRSELHQLWLVATRNLQGSIPPFVLVFLAYLAQMHALGKLFRKRRPPIDMVMRREQLIDLCASLFFGIGVIWTAIGMRSALLFALGDTAQVTADSGMAVLQRLVDGGILLALSTTIVGGIGGYLMRAGKQLLFGRELAMLYLQVTQASAASEASPQQPEHQAREKVFIADEPIF